MPAAGLLLGDMLETLRADPAYVLGMGRKQRQHLSKCHSRMQPLQAAKRAAGSGREGAQLALWQVERAQALLALIVPRQRRQVPGSHASLQDMLHCQTAITKHNQSHLRTAQIVC